MSTPTATRAGDATKQRLLEAGEHLFARKGIDGVTIRELIRRAGQRNESALHYHFGSRDGLVTAILRSHQVDVDASMDAELDQRGIGAGASVHDVLAAVVPGVADKLLEPRGRDFLRIVPQILPQLTRTVRAGRIAPTTRTTDRVMLLLDRGLHELPEALRLERLVSYVLILTTTLGERAQSLEEDQPVGLDHDAFVANLIAVLAGALSAPDPTRVRRSP